MFSSIEFLLLIALKNYLAEFASEFDFGSDLGMDHVLSDVLSEMDIYPIKKGFLPILVTRSWHDWQRQVDSAVNFEEKKRNKKIAQVLQSEQSFAAAFKFLNEVFFVKNHEITIGEAIQELDKCSKDIRENKVNILWNIWIRYLEAELDNEYVLDYSGPVKPMQSESILKKLISSVQCWKK